MERLRSLCCLGHTVGHAGLLLTDHGNAPQPLEEDAEGEEEPLFLHQEIALHALGTRIELPEDKVPVAGMGSQADNILIGMILRDFRGPSQMFV